MNDTHNPDNVFFKHLVLTRFSLRGKNAFPRKKLGNKSLWYHYKNPLRSDKLDNRFKLFEMFCLPSILGQTIKNFHWIIIVDKDLPGKYKKKLSNLLPGEMTSIHKYSEPEDDLETLDWLKPYFTGNPSHLLTTNLDDDDALPVDFFEKMQNHVQQLFSSEKITPVKTIGATQVVFWDLLSTKKAPFGRKGKLLIKNKTSSVGFSLFAKYPAFNFNVLGLRHQYADHYFDRREAALNEHVLNYRKWFGMAEDDVDFEMWSKENTYYDLSKEIGPVLMVNHTQNVQARRLFIMKKEYKPVNEPAEFQNFNLDPVKIKKYAPSFTKVNAIRKFLDVFLIKKYKYRYYNSAAEYYRNFFKLMQILMKR